MTGVWPRYLATHPTSGRNMSIVLRRLMGETATEIGRDYDISKQRVSQIVYNRRAIQGLYRTLDALRK